MELTAPLMNAAGTVKLVEQVERLARAPLGALVVGSYTLDERTGNGGRVYESQQPWTLNALGMPNPGIDYLVRHRSTMGEMVGARPLIVSIAGFSVAEYGELAARTEGGYLELNLGCPNVWHDGEQKRIGSFDPTYVVDALSAVRTSSPYARVGLKLSPYSDPMLLAEVAAQLAPSPPDFLTLSNTFPNAWREDTLDVPYGGLSGAAMRPIVLGQIKQFRALLPDVPIIGAGGVRTGEDWFEYEAAGACAIQVGSRFLDGDENPDVFVSMLGVLV